MAVTVIAPPDPNDAQKKKCKNCGVTVQFFPVDIKEYSGRDYSGGPDGCEWVDCPNCNERIILRSW